jgi:hypothetical protein
VALQNGHARSDVLPKISEQETKTNPKILLENMMCLSYGCVSDEWNQPEQLLVAAATVEPSFYGFTNYWNMVFYQAGTVRLARAE